MIYMHNLSGQTVPFAAKAVYYSLPRCRGLLKHQLNNYNRYTFKFDEDWTKEEENKYLQEAMTATATLQALFCDKTEFASTRSTIKTLDKGYKRGDPSRLLNMMIVWYTDRLRGKNQEDGTSYTSCEANTAAELHRALDPLITPRHAYDMPSLWPLVEKVYVGVPASRVLRHLTIVDLPGMSRSDTTFVLYF